MIFDLTIFNLLEFEDKDITEALIIKPFETSYMYIFERVKPLINLFSIIY